MTGFQAVNTTLNVPEPPSARSGGETTPTTPRPNSKFFPDPQPAEDQRVDDPTAKTPTRNSFGGLAAQRPLPSDPFGPSGELGKSPNQSVSLNRGNSHRSTQSVDSQDIEMGEMGEDGKDGSDNESVTSDTNRPSKKKKGQRFFCTEFPPCQLSFTRSEHLARHIRKHTGERPFQCHCSRRFSRLDNLRQHAQTVHVNEDIPGDSLAATGTRFQRQIRTDRVRPPGGRARASTLGSQGGHSRGHSRNLSTSSIASTSSNVSVQSQDLRRRPPPLAMANDTPGRARLSLSTFDAYNPPLMGSPGPQIVEYSGQSNGATTPTSATFSTGTESPGRFGSGLQSPMPSAAHPVSWGSRTPGRRLSVPSGANNFQGPAGSSFPTPYLTPLPSSTSSTFSGQSSLFASPINTNFIESRRESSASNADSDWRRRTWHPGTYTNLGPRPATSGLGYYQTVGADRPSFTSQPAASQTTRLPGIESFDHAPPPPPILRRHPSPMQLDVPARPLTYHAPSDLPAPVREKRQSISWDTTLQRDIKRLHIASPNPPSRDWAQYQPSQPSTPGSRPTTAPHPSYSEQIPINSMPHPIQAAPQKVEQPGQEPPVTPRKNKRHGWYNGPLSQQMPSPAGRVVQRTSPEDSSSSEGVHTPLSTSMSEYNPAIVHSNGYVEAPPPGLPVEEHKPAPPPPMVERNQPQYQPYTNNSLPPPSYRPEPLSAREPFQFASQANSVPNDMRRLEALVAVATNEQQVVAQR